VIAECPCGSGQRYDQCCGRLHRGAALAQTPEELMRSRYSAYALGEFEYILATWHPRTRPDSISGGGLTWTGLEVTGHGDDWVEFTARYRADDGSLGAMTEHSLFERRAGRWFYVEGDVADQ
jgi:SEC-C motif-containing protein